MATREDAKAALRGMGIAPTRGLIEDWLKAAAAESQTASEAAPGIAARGAGAPSPLGTSETAAVPPAVRPAPSSKSRLEPILREQGALVEPSQSKRRKPGRPRIIASWFPAVAQSMEDGTSLRTALGTNGLNLSENEMRALYRNKTFKALYQEARRRYLIENWGRSKMPSLRSLIGRYLEAPGT